MRSFSPMDTKLIFTSWENHIYFIKNFNFYSFFRNWVIAVLKPQIVHLTNSLVFRILGKSTDTFVRPLITYFPITVSESEIVNLLRCHPSKSNFVRYQIRSFFSFFIYCLGFRYFVYANVFEFLHRRSVCCIFWRQRIV